MCIIKSAFYHIYPNPKISFYFFVHLFLFHIFLPLFVELAPLRGVDGNILNFKHVAPAGQSRLVRVTGPCTTNSKVEDNVHGRVCKRSPEPLVAKLRADKSVEESAVEVPLDGLRLPVIRRAVDLESPGVEVVVLGNGNALAQARGLVARTAAGVVAVGGAVAGQLAVDLLKDVELSAERPGSAVAHGVTEHPEGGPHALLGVEGAGATTQSSLNLHGLAGSWSPGLDGFDAGRGPFAGLSLLRDELESLAARELHVGIGLGVSLELLVVVEVGDDGPLGEVNHVALLANKGLLPDEVHAGEVWGESGRDGGDGQGQEVERLEMHLGDECVVAVVGLISFRSGIQGSVSKERVLL